IGLKRGQFYEICETAASIWQDLDEINDDDLLIEEIIDLSNPAFIGNNDSFIEEQSKVSNNIARWSASGNHDYNPARLYFNRKSAKWTIIKFLNECEEETFRKKIDSYLKLLQNIVDLDPERKRKERARELLDAYKEAKWEKEHKTVSRPSIHFHQITDSSVVRINSGSLYVNRSKRNHEKDDFKNPIEQITKKECQTKSGRKIPNYHELTSSSSEGDDNASFDYEQPIIEKKTSAIHSTKRVKSSGQTESEKYQVLDDSETFFNEDYTDDEFNTSPIEADLKKFKETYLTMDPDYMWTLKTGRKVETVIYEFAKSLHRESYLHSFIINDADVETKSLFLPEEWKEIKNLEVIDRPKLDPCHKELLRKYTVNDIKKLRSLLFELFIPDGKEYNRNIHFCLDYINNAYRGILRLWEMDENPFDSLKLEGWFEMNVWGRLIDPAFDNLNIDLIRGDGMSFASSERKNIQRKINDHKKFGRKGDGVFRLHKGRLEFGAIEAGRNWEEINGTKYMSDSLKISKMLKDMLDKLIREYHPEGYITRINRNNVQEVAEVLYARSITIATMDVIDKKDDLKIETFLDDSDDGYHTPPTNITTNTFTTPNKSRTKDMINEIKNSVKITIPRYDRQLF
ncbi:16015_t:CDS:2, partial [Racocetra persica]